MQEDVRCWDNVRLELELWLGDTEVKAIGKKVAELTMEELQKELKILETILPELDNYKKKMKQLNERSNNLIETYSNDDSTNVSQVSSAINTKWAQLNDTIRVRRAVLEASLRGRKDFSSAVDEFLEWLRDIERRSEVLDVETSNASLIKDTHNRKVWMEQEAVSF